MLEAAGFQLDNSVPMCDMKTESFQWVKHRWMSTAGCFWPSMQAAVESRACFFHRHKAGGCSLPQPGKTDIAVAMGPCQAFTLQSRSSLAPEDHKSHGVVMDRNSNSLLGWVARVLPLYYITEQVEGFGKTRAQGRYSNTSPLIEFVRSMFLIKGPDGKSWFGDVAILKTCCSVWIEARRPRPPRTHSRNTIPTT